MNLENFQHCICEPKTYDYIPFFFLSGKLVELNSKYTNNASFYKNINKIHLIVFKNVIKLVKI